MSHRFSITLLGGFRARRDDTLIELPPGCQRLSALLALSRGPVDRDCLCARLWPEVPAGSAIARVRSTLWRLRCYGVEDMLATDPRTFAIAPGVDVDWWRAVDLSFQVVSDLALTGTTDPVLLDELVPLLRAGELLDGWSDEWAVRESGRYHAVHSYTLDRLATWSSDSTIHRAASHLVDSAVGAAARPETAPTMLSASDA